MHAMKFVDRQTCFAVFSVPCMIAFGLLGAALAFS